MNKKVDVLEVMHSVLGDLMAAQIAGVDTNTDVNELSASIDAVAELIKSAKIMRDVIHDNGCYDDGAFYYFGLSSPELERPLSGIDAAVARIRGAA